MVSGERAAACCAKNAGYLCLRFQGLFTLSVTDRHGTPGSLPKEHRFQYRTAMVLLDLDRLSDFQGSMLAVNRLSVLSFKTHRHLCDNIVPSGNQAREFVAGVIDTDVSGPVKLLTNPHFLGIGFNPLSVYFLHSKAGEPAAAIYEVSNTPWNEIHRYVIPYRKIAQNNTYWFDKEFHVSPFNPMGQRYVTKARWPSESDVSIYLGLQNVGADELMFEAGLSLRLTPFNGHSIKPLFTGIWPQSILVIGGIYREAFALWRKGLRYHPHP